MSKAFDNFTLMKALELEDENLAIKIISAEDLDGKELSGILATHFSKSIKSKKTGQPLQLSNKIIVAGLLNRMNQLAAENQTNK